MRVHALLCSSPDAEMVHACSRSTIMGFTCQCNVGYYGNGNNCRRCCDFNAEVISDCPAGSQENSAVCTCLPGYYGDGHECKVCTISNQNAVISNPGQCLPEVKEDSVKCMCYPGYYGDWQNCSICPVGYYSNGTICVQCACQTLDNCAAGSPVNTASCACNEGYYGNGERCPPCRKCDFHAVSLTTCKDGSTYDSTTCSCKAGPLQDTMGTGQSALNAELALTDFLRAHALLAAKWTTWYAHATQAFTKQAPRTLRAPAAAPRAAASYLLQDMMLDVQRYCFNENWASRPQRLFVFKFWIGLRHTATK